MKRIVVLVVVVLVGGVMTAVWGGHEFPIYPSYYPHEIRIETLPPDRAGELLVAGKLQAYLGAEPHFGKSPPESIRPIASLGSFVILRVNPYSPRLKDDAAACAAASTVVRQMTGSRGDVVFDPYPVTPLQGDYFYYADLAEAAKTRILRTTHAATLPGGFKLLASDLAQRLVPHAPRISGSDWDIAVEEVDAGSLVTAALLASNGGLGPPWARSGWFTAWRLLSPSLDTDARNRLGDLVRRLETGAYANAVERINLERELVGGLASQCRALTAGYTLKREFLNAEYSSGIENVAFDALAGLNTPIFIRTAKLKDFPWNGWLNLGIASPPTAAWNPVAGFTDPFGRVMWGAVGDPALVPAPNDATWIINRISDVQSNRHP